MQIDAPVISAIIPTYRRPHLLRRAIRSVLDQTYPHLRVCVYDNASGDETAAIVAQFSREDPRVIYHCHAENIGLSANFTYAMEHVDTPFFALLADDDFYLPTFFETAMTGFTEYPDAMCSAGAVVYATEDLRVLLVSSLAGYFVPPDGLSEWLAGEYPSITGFVFRRELNERVGTMDAAILHSDYDYLLRVLPRFPHVLSATPSMVVVYHDQQSTKRAGIDVRLRSYRHLQNRMHNNDAIPTPMRLRMEDDLNKTFVNSVFTAGLHALCERDFPAAHEAVAVLRDPFGVKRKATILALATAACQKSSAISRLLRLFRTLALKWSHYRRARKYRAMQYELKGRVSAMGASST
jgi:glycosyltransferase involved in cell wall biosynthesis